MEGNEIPEKDYKQLIIKRINKLREYLRNILREQIQDMKDHFNKEL